MLHFPDALIIGLLICKKDGLKVSFWPVLQHSLNSSVKMLDFTHLNLSGNHSIIDIFLYYPLFT